MSRIGAPPVEVNAAAVWSARGMTFDKGVSECGGGCGRRTVEMNAPTRMRAFDQRQSAAIMRYAAGAESLRDIRENCEK
jgi:hypothetical protein